MHIYHHPIAFMTIDSSRNHHQGVLRNEIPDASFALLVSLAEGFDIEFQGIGADEKQKQTP